MQHVLLKFDIFRLVSLDNGSLFKGVFTAISKTLNIHYGILVKRNHKGILVENVIALSVRL